METQVTSKTQTQMKRSSSFKLWDKRLRTEDVLTRGQITQFCNAIAAGAYGFVIRGYKTNLTSEECVTLLDTFDEKTEGYELTTEHTQFGLEWLRAIPNRAESVGVTKEILETFIEFRFIDVQIDQIRDSWMGRTYANLLPVYRVMSEVGSIDYFWSPWQRGAYG